MLFQIVRPRIQRRSQSPLYRQFQATAYLLIVFLTLASAKVVAQNAQAPASRTPAPDVRVEFLGAEKGYAIRGGEVTLLCVVRNIGTASLPAKTVRLHCYPVSGLDYTSGETLPILPELARNQAVSYRWRLELNEDGNPLVAGVLLEHVVASPAVATGGPAATAEPEPEVTLRQRVVLTTIPILNGPLHGSNRSVSRNAAPQVASTAEDAWLANDRVAARIISADRRRPVLALSVRNGGSWVDIATGASLGEVRSAEEGQNPWGETFRWHRSRIQSNSEAAILTLEGTCGAHWRAELVLETQRDTAAIKGSLRLTALKTMRLFAVQTPQLLMAADPKNVAPPKADGSSGAIPNEEPLLPQDARVTAARANGATVGLSWPANSPFAGGEWQGLPVGDSVFAPHLGAQWTEERGEVISQGATVVFPFRLFALAPSDTVRDALRFILP